MKIEQVHIQKFRSIDDATIYFNQVLAIVGANNVGKSHVLRALNAFFNYLDELEGFKEQDHAFSLKSRPKITITFSDVKEKDCIPLEYISNGKLTVRFSYRWDRKAPSYEVIIDNEQKTISADIFESLMRSFRFIYVPIIRNSDVTFSSEDSVSYVLLSTILRQQIAKRNTLQPIVNTLYRKIEDTVFKSAIQRIKRYYPFNDNSNFKFRISNDDPIDSIIHNVTLELIEHTQHNSIKNCGSGIQSAIYFAIMLATTMDSDMSCMIGIEEPELNMHPQAQRELISSIQNKTQYPNSQFVITTHSTVIIDHLGHQSVVLCRKNKGKTRDIVTTITQVGKDFWEKYQIKEDRYNNFFEYKNSDFFFSDYVIITESPVDCGILSYVFEKHHINSAESGITFIPINGEKNIKYPYSIAKELGIPFFCVVDRDVFQPYTNNIRKDSIDANGLPTYREELKTSAPICGLLSAEDKATLLKLLIANKYDDVCSLLDKYRIITFRYAIEVDLIACQSYCSAFCDILNLSEDNRTAKYLAEKRSDAIKKIETIRDVLDMTSIRNLPSAYKQIIRKTRELLQYSI